MNIEANEGKAMKIEVKVGGNLHVDGLWLADVNEDTAWMRLEAARFLAGADFLDELRK